MNVLIIGGTRFMGPSVVKELTALGHQVTLFHRGQTPADVSADVQEILGDRNHLRDHEKQIRKAAPEIILDMMLLTEQQARDLVSIASGIARRLVVASSCDVYFNYDLLRGVESGPVVTDRLGEESPLRQKMYPYRNMVDEKSDPLYDYDKILVERVILSDSSIAGTVLRLPMVYGPGDYRHRLYEIIRRVQDRRPAILLGEAQAVWRTTRGFVDDCAHAICLAVTDERAAGRVYNVAEPVACTEHELTERITKAMGWSGRIVTVPDDSLPEHLKDDTRWEHHLDIDTTRIRNELGFTEQTDIDERISRTIAWELANPPDNYTAPNYEAEDRVLATVER
ncbi:MAG: NAD-dependent epimerase/dehydratase family protein [candidate division Zixibacteria bacterium]|nr:NAD-dependent epimerase/dehydratase family protein [candidate division Zixibacteria bacterium]